MNHAQLLALVRLTPTLYFFVLKEEGVRVA